MRWDGHTSQKASSLASQVRNGTLFKLGVAAPQLGLMVGGSSCVPPGRAPPGRQVQRLSIDAPSPLDCCDASLPTANRSAYLELCSCP